MYEKSRVAFFFAFFVNMWVCLKIGILIDKNFSEHIVFPLKFRQTCTIKKFPTFGYPPAPLVVKPFDRNTNYVSQPVCWDEIWLVSP